MKLTILFLTAAVLQVSAKGFSQTVTLSLNNAPIAKVFTEIEKQTGFTFLYTDQMLENIQPVSISVKDAALENVLDICLKNLPLGYSIVSKTIILKPIENYSSPVKDDKSISFIEISGRVTDEDDNGLQGASVKVKGKAEGTSTDANGFF